MKEHGPASPDAFSPELARFLDLFREGRFWEGHEALEAAWRRNRSRFYKGLILYASAFVHAGRGNTHGLRAQLRKTTTHLQPFAPAYLGFDVNAILKHARECLDRVEDGEDVTRLPPPALDWDPRRVRGDERELGPPHEP